MNMLNNRKKIGFGDIFKVHTQLDSDLTDAF